MTTTITQCTNGIDTYTARTDNPPKVRSILEKYGCMPYVDIRPSSIAGQGRVKMYIRPDTKLMAVPVTNVYECADPFEHGYDAFNRSFAEVIIDGKRQFRKMMIALAKHFTSRCVVHNISFSSILDRADNDAFDRIPTGNEASSPKQIVNGRQINLQPFGKVMERIQQLGRSIQANSRSGLRPCPAKAEMRSYLRSLSQEELVMATVIISIGEDTSDEPVDVYKEFVDISWGYRNLGDLTKTICHMRGLPEIIEKGIRRIQDMGISLDDFRVIRK